MLNGYSLTPFARGVLMLQEQNLSDTAQRLISLFDSAGFVGISEFVRAIDQGDSLGIHIKHLRVSCITATHKGKSIENDTYEFTRLDSVEPLQELIELANFFNTCSNEEQVVMNAVLQEVALGIAGKGIPTLFAEFEITVGY